MNVPFEVNKDRLIAEINGKKKLRKWITIDRNKRRSFCTNVFFYVSGVL